jgi:hypothetical protein
LIVEHVVVADKLVAEEALDVETQQQAPYSNEAKEEAVVHVKYDVR